jgi:hypothetical protein
LENLLPSQTLIDCLNFITQVFEQKKKALVKDIKACGYFGKHVFHVYHDTTHKYHIVCAEFPNQNEDSALFKIIL